MKKKYFLLLFAVLISCSDAEIKNDISNAVTITSVDKVKGEAFTTVTITGTGFFDKENNNPVTILFNGKVGKKISVTSTTLVATVPLAAMSGNITILKDGKEIIGPYFQYVSSYDNVKSITNDITFYAVDNSMEYWRMTMDSYDNIYIANEYSYLIKKIDKYGDVSNFAGSGKYGNQDGDGSNAKLMCIKYLTIDNQGFVYVNESNLTNTTYIRKISPGGHVATFAIIGDPRTGNLVIDKNGNIYTTFEGEIFKFSSSGIRNTFISKKKFEDYYGASSQYSMFDVANLAMDSEDNLYFVYLNRITKISSKGEISTVNSDFFDQKLFQNKSLNSFIIGKNKDFYFNDYLNNNIIQVNQEGTARNLLISDSIGKRDGNVDYARISLGGRQKLIMDKNDNILFLNRSSDVIVREITKEK